MMRGAIYNGRFYFPPPPPAATSFGPPMAQPKTFDRKWISCPARILFSAPAPGSMPGATASGFMRRIILDCRVLLLPAVDGEVLYHGDVAPDFTEVAAVGDMLIFAGTVPGAGAELCAYDDTTGLAFLAMDIEPGAVSSRPTALTRHNGGIVFIADTCAHGKELSSTGKNEGAPNDLQALPSPRQWRRYAT